MASARGNTGKSTARIASMVTSIICARYVLNADSRVVSETSVDVVRCWGVLSSEPGAGCGVGDTQGDTAPPKGSGVPDWCGGKRIEIATAGRSKAADNVPGRSAKRVIERRRGITRSSHSERKRKELSGGNRERMAECSMTDALRKRAGKQRTE